MAGQDRKTEHGVGTANVGVINGGDATNVVTPEVTLRAEARSHDAAMRTRIVSQIKAAFEQAAAEVCNVEGSAGMIEFDSHVDYDAFRLPDDHPSVLAAMDAIRSVGRDPYCEVANGGLDANWLFKHGIESVTLGCGQRNIHTADEWLDIDSYQTACRIATALITRRPQLMDDDQDLCLCFHVSRRKVAQYIRAEKPSVTSQFVAVLRGGNGLWVVPSLPRENDAGIRSGSGRIARPGKLRGETKSVSRGLDVAESGLGFQIVKGLRSAARLSGACRQTGSPPRCFSVS